MIRSALAALVLIASTAGLSHADKAGQANTVICKRFYAEINKGNLKVIDELVADDFTEHEVFPDLSPDKQGLKKFFAMMRAAFPDLRFDVEFFVADGDKVVAYLTMNGTHKGEFMNMAATGNMISVKTVDIIQMKNGKVIEHWGVTDGMSMMDQLGASKSE